MERAVWLINFNTLQSSYLNCQSDFFRPLSSVGNNNKFIPLISLQQGNDTLRYFFRWPQRCSRERRKQCLIGDFYIRAILDEGDGQQNKYVQRKTDKINLFKSSNVTNGK